MDGLSAIEPAVLLALVAGSSPSSSPPLDAPAPALETFVSASVDPTRASDSSTELLFIVLVAIIPPRGYGIRESGPQRPTKQSRHVCDRLCEEKQRCVPYERRRTTDPQSSNLRRNDGISVDFRFPPSHLSSLSSRVVSASDCARFESHR